MRKRIAEWCAQGAVQAIGAAMAMGAIGLVWKVADTEILIGVTCIVLVGLGTAIAIRVFSIPKFKFPTEEEYQALRTLGKVDDGTVYMTAEKKPE